MRVHHGNGDGPSFDSTTTVKSSGASPSRATTSLCALRLHLSLGGDGLHWASETAALTPTTCSHVKEQASPRLPSLLDRSACTSSCLARHEEAARAADARPLQRCSPRAFHPPTSTSRAVDEALLGPRDGDEDTLEPSRRDRLDPSEGAEDPAIARNAPYSTPASARRPARQAPVIAAARALHLARVRPGLAASSPRLLAPPRRRRRVRSCRARWRASGGPPPRSGGFERLLTSSGGYGSPSMADAARRRAHGGSLVRCAARRVIGSDAGVGRLMVAPRAVLLAGLPDLWGPSCFTDAAASACLSSQLLRMTPTSPPTIRRPRHDR